MCIFFVTVFDSTPYGTRQIVYRMRPVTDVMKSRYLLTRVNPSGKPISHPKADPKETIPTSVKVPSAPTLLSGPPLSPCDDNVAI